VQIDPARGATLIELTLVLAISSILCIISILHAGSFIDRMEVRGAVTEIESLFSVARHAAIARGSQSVLNIDASSGLLTVSAGGAAVVSRNVGAVHGVTISTARSSMTYSPIGVGYGAANFSLIVSRRAASDTIIISRLGRVRHQ